MPLPASNALEELREALRISQSATAAMETDINAIGRRVEQQQQAIKLRQAERQQLQMIITAAQRELDERRKQLSSTDRALVDLRKQLAQAQAQLEQLDRQYQALESSGRETIVIQHIPTPMAKTVFGREVHFRLRRGYLAYVPLDELVDRMKREIRVKAEKLRSTPRTIETVGPVAGFHLQYELRLVDRVETTNLGQRVAQVPEFVGFQLIPASDFLGEPFEEALRPESQFMRLIRGLDPDTTTITVWVYADSFPQFLTLKQALFQRGFLTAARPLPDSYPIAGSPHGQRSAAQ